MNQEDRTQIERALEAAAQAYRILNNVALPEDDCCSARKLDADRRGKALIFIDSEGSNEDAEQHSIRQNLRFEPAKAHLIRWNSSIHRFVRLNERGADLRAESG